MMTWTLLLFFCVNSIAICFCAHNFDHALLDRSKLNTRYVRSPLPTEANISTNPIYRHDSPTESAYMQSTRFARRKSWLACNDAAAWMDVASVFASSDDVHILVVGGSETAGILCFDGVNRTRECAWSARLRDMLHGSFRKKIVVRNIASGGTTITAGLASLGAWLSSNKPPDIMFVDYIVNDSFEHQIGDNEKNRGFLIAAYERFIHTAKKLSPKTQIVFVNTCTLEKCDNVDALIKIVAEQHNVPVVSMGQLVFINSMTSNETDLGTLYWHVNATHPPYFVHKLIAHVVHSCNREKHATHADAANKELLISSKQHYDSLYVCEKPLSSYTASVGNHYSGVKESNWPLHEDRKGKPGWISTSADSTISFELQFGKSPRIVISYLKSYEGLANAEMWADDDTAKSVVVPGMYDNPGVRVSQTTVYILHAALHEFQPEHNLDGIVGWHFEPGSKHTLHFRVNAMSNATKFKIISVQSC